MYPTTGGGAAHMTGLGERHHHCCKYPRHGCGWHTTVRVINPLHTFGPVRATNIQRRREQNCSAPRLHSYASEIMHSKTSEAKMIRSIRPSLCESGQTFMGVGRRRDLFHISKPCESDQAFTVIEHNQTNVVVHWLCWMEK